MGNPVTGASLKQESHLEIEISGRLTQFKFCYLLYLHYTCKSLRLQCFFCKKNIFLKLLPTRMSDRVGKGSDFIKNETFPKALFIQFCFTFTTYCAIIFLKKVLQYLMVCRI